MALTKTKLENIKQQMKDRVPSDMKDASDKHPSVWFEEKIKELEASE